MNKQNKLESIHLSLINGQKRQMADYINDYGLYDFWADYTDYLNNTYVSLSSQLAYLEDCIISYHRIMNR